MEDKEKDKKITINPKNIIKLVNQESNLKKAYVPCLKKNKTQSKDNTIEKSMMETNNTCKFEM